MARWLNYTHARVYPMYPDTELDFGDVKIRALYGRHAGLKEGINDLTKRVCSVDDAKAINTFEEAFLRRAPDATFIQSKHGEWLHL